MLIIRRMAFDERGVVTEIEFDEHPNAEEVAEFCAKYKIGWQNFNQETIAKKPLSTEWLGRGGYMPTSGLQPLTEAIGKPVDLTDVPSPLQNPPQGNNR